MDLSSQPAQAGPKLNRDSDHLVKAHEEANRKKHDQAFATGIASELAAWYERLRTAIENRDEEVILRAAIERILRRRLLLGGNGKTVGPLLVRELIWARYFPEESISDDQVLKVEETIDLYLELRNLIPQHNKIPESELNEWTYHLMASDLEDRLNPTPQKEAMISYIFRTLRKMVTIHDDTEETRDIQVFIAIRKAFAKEDLPFLRYALFNQYFGRLSSDTIQQTAQKFSEGKSIIEKHLNYKGRFKIFEYVKRQIPPFLILEDIFENYNSKIRQLISNPSEFTSIITETCNAHYANIAGKVRRAIIRSIIFILLSKSFLAFFVEGTYDRLVHGQILWGRIAINITIPVAMMILVSFLIKAPGADNTRRIIDRINSLLFDETPELGRALMFNHKPRAQNLIDTIFTAVWLGTFFLSFGAIVYVLTLLNFSFVSQAFFIFFFALITFLSYRIKQAADVYTVREKTGLLTPFVDFFFMPIVRVGRYLAEGVRQINVFIFVLDVLIEAPLKGIIAISEQWFRFLHSKREDLA
jgi:hypothetical protein